MKKDSNDLPQINQPKHHHHHHHSKKRKIWTWVLGVLAFFIAVGAIGAIKIYTDTKSAVQSTYKAASHKNLRKGSSVSVTNGDPFSVMILGIDTGEYGRTYQGRSDTIMVAAVSKSKTTLVSVPRDTKVAISGHGSNNKINAAYAYGGISGAINTLQSYLDIPIDHYVKLNMRGLQQLSAAVGPIKVDNDLKFTNLGYHFKKGTVTINQSNILAYTRMRYQDPRGDYGRQLRQRIVLIALARKLVSIGNITKYKQILTTISSNMTTDLTFNELKALVTEYSGAAKSIKQVQLQGTGKEIDGVDYEVVSSENLTKVQNILKNALNE
ncbi:LCP family protein [Ligilactobacillus sp. WILCCON 0076]|uniref:LCP family protein n=1 Tax=Ligilactobacillus ubinensis TaxID=2876789 RepID=A0A9X2FS89_9LACO|nr:LCP family protein [Ligilactobacillus ubinensis]MCP0888008.1 LCP family protein [Ligilactobacillus ubinensis]